MTQHTAFSILTSNGFSDSMSQHASSDIVSASNGARVSSSAGSLPVTRVSRFDTGERLRLMRDGVVNYSGFVASGLAGIVLVPVMLRYLGTESYGLWLAALAMAGMLGGFDFGLYWSVTREVSGGLNAARREETVDFAMSAGNLYLLLGIIGALLISVLGLPIRGGLHLSTQHWEIAPKVFLFVGVSFVADRLVIFTNAVLSGLRRFGTMNAITIGAVSLRLLGSLMLLWTGRSVLAIAFWNALVSLLWAWVALTLVGSVEPQLRFRVGRLRWRLLRPHISFGILSFLTTLVGRIVWDMAPLIIGFSRGSASIVPYSIGRRFPIAVSDLNYRSAETLFPAARERMTANDWIGTRGVLHLGTRWILVMALPFCIVLSILAPNLLHAWVGTISHEGVVIMRLTCVAVVAESLGMGAMHVLWGRGAVRTIFAVLAAVAVPSLALTVGLVGSFGAVGAAFSFCISLSASACIFVILGARTCLLPMAKLLGDTFRGLLVPSIACAVCTYAIATLGTPQRWVGVVGSCVAGGLTYLVVFYFFAAQREERQFVRQMLGL